MCFRFIIPIAACLVLGTPASAEIVLASYASPPFSNETGTGQVDMAVREAFQRIGKQVSIKLRPIKRGLAGVEHGQFDGMYLRVAAVADQSEKLIYVPGPLFRSRYVAIAIDPDLRINNWQSLKELRVAYPLGWQVFDSRQRHYGNVTTADDPDKLVNMLMRKRVDLILVEQVWFQSLAEERNLGDYRILRPMLDSQEVSLVLNIRHKGIVADLAEAIRGLYADGTLARFCPVCAESLD